MQLAMTERAAMHGMLAISMLYEDFEPSWKKMQDKEAALKHYNQALRIVASRELETATVLVMSAIFTCVEFLRGNEAAAATHCRHATLVSRFSGSRDDGVMAMLQQLSIFPYFFSGSRDDDVMAVLQQLSIFPYFFSTGGFPTLATASPPIHFDTVTQAALALDEWMGQGIRLVRSLDGYRLDFEGATMPLDASDTQFALLKNLSKWKTAYEDLSNRTHIELSTHNILLIKFHVSWIWSCIALRKDEMGSDSFQGEFSDIIDLAGDLSLEGSQLGNFAFGMGVSPLLHFVVIKCRHLPTRLKALEMLRKMGKRRESLWDAETMCRVGKYIVEREHGIRVTPGMEVSAWDFPGDEARVRDSFLDCEVFENRDELGNEVLGRRFYVFVREGGAVIRHPDWLSVAVE